MSAPGPAAAGIDFDGIILSVEGAEPDQLPDHAISVLNDICVERARMIAEGDTAAIDDGVSTGLWHDRIEAILDNAERMHRAGVPATYRSMMVAVAAMACAAVERHDRVEGTVPDLATPRGAAHG